MAFNNYRKRIPFDPQSKEPFRVSRSKIDLFRECPRCFYLDQRLGIKRPDTYPLTLNLAVDELMKKEFDLLRKSQNPHPVMEQYHIDAVPLQHQDLDVWRDALKRGIEYLDPTTNLSVRGGIDDVWVRPSGELHIVDYKAKATRSEITLDGDLGKQYKRQAEVYQWLFRKNGFKVSPTAYFVFVNGKKDAEKFDGKLEFSMSIIPCEGNTDWIEPTLLELKQCLVSDRLPAPYPDCAYCTYRRNAAEAAAHGTSKAKHEKKEGHEAKQENIFGKSI